MAVRCARRQNVNVLPSNRPITIHGSWQRYGHVLCTTKDTEVIKFHISATLITGISEIAVSALRMTVHIEHQEMLTDCRNIHCQIVEFIDSVICASSSCNTSQLPPIAVLANSCKHNII